MSEKELALRVLQSLPETATLHEIREELEVLSAVKEGQADIRAGRYTSVEEARKQLATWIGK